MTSGIKDYNDRQMENWTIYHPNDDYTPFDYLYSLDKKFNCVPGKCLVYCSNGYGLLALVVAYHNGAKSWDDFNQMNYFPEDMQKYFNETLFTMRGKCS